AVQCCSRLPQTCRHRIRVEPQFRPDRLLQRRQHTRGRGVWIFVGVELDIGPGARLLPRDVPLHRLDTAPHAPHDIVNAHHSPYAPTIDYQLTTDGGTMPVRVVYQKPTAAHPAIVRPVARS